MSANFKQALLNPSKIGSRQMYLLERPFIDCRVINNSHFTLSGAQKIIYSFTQKLSRAAERTHIHLPTNGTDQCMGSASMLIQGGKINKKKMDCFLFPSCLSCQHILLILENANKQAVPTRALPTIRRGISTCIWP